MNYFEEKSFLLLHYDKMVEFLPSCVVVVLSPEFEPSVDDMVVGESFPVVTCVEPSVDVVLVVESSCSLVAVVLLCVVTAVVVVVVNGAVLI